MQDLSRWLLGTLSILMCFHAPVASALAVAHELVSAGTPSDAAAGPSAPVAINSADGRFVLFGSAAADVIGDVRDHNGSNDVFLHDRVNGTTVLVSRALGVPTQTANANAEPSALSADGRWVLYTSYATNVISGIIDNNANLDVYLFDRIDGSTTLVSRAAAVATTAANHGSLPFALSPDGRWVLFRSNATNVSVGQTDNNAAADVFLFDRDSGSSTLVSRASSLATATANAFSTPTALSADGRWVLFRSDATNLVSGLLDVNGKSDAFLFDRNSGVSLPVSRALGVATATANAESYPAALSDDGRWALYTSAATNVVSGGTDANGSLGDVFLFDRVGGNTTLVSHAAGVTSTTANGASTAVGLSADGRWVLFDTAATNCIAGLNDSNANPDVLLYDRDSGATSLISRTAGSATSTANALSQAIDISADGGWVVFQSGATNLISGLSDSNSNDETYLYGRQSGSVMLVSRALGSATTTANEAVTPVAISADGRFVAHSSRATDLVVGMVDDHYFPDAFLFDRDQQSTTLISQSSGALRTADGGSYAGGISADNRWLLFDSEASNVIGGVRDSNGSLDVFLLDRSSGVRTLVTRALVATNATANAESFGAGLSADGRWVLFQSRASNLVSGVTDGNSQYDVFLYDRIGATSVLLSRATGPTLATAAGYSAPAALSADGRWALFSSTASNVYGTSVDNNGNEDVFLYNRDSGSAILVSHAAGTPTVTANGYSIPVALSADGRWILFDSMATNLVDGVVDSNEGLDAYLYDRDSGQTLLVSRAQGSATTTAAGNSTATKFSADGRWILFHSTGSNLVPGMSDNNSDLDAFLFDRDTGATTLISGALGSTTTTADGSSSASAISASGRWILFASSAPNIVGGVVDSNQVTDAFLFDRDSRQTVLLSQSSGAAATTANAPSTPTAISPDGRFAVYMSDATNITGVDEDRNGFSSDVFVYDRDRGTTTLVSRSVSSPAMTGDAESVAYRISADGQIVLLSSRASDLIDGVADGNVSFDAFASSLVELPDALYADGFE